MKKKSFDQDSSYSFNTGDSLAFTQFYLHKFYEDF